MSRLIASNENIESIAVELMRRKANPWAMANYRPFVLITSNKATVEA